MKRQFLLTILTIFTLVVALPQMAAAISFEQVSQIAKQTTVLIDGCNSGSGVIFRHEGNNYYVLTAKHVVENAKLTCLVITPDGARQEVDASKTTIPVADVDLAVVQFTSNQNYQLAQFGDSNQATPGKTVYVAGAPEPSEAIPQRTLLVVPGNIVGIQSPQSGYSLIYTNPTRRGMSGSPVLNEEGQVIGIHGQGDQQDGGKTGLNLGIPIKMFLESPQVSPIASPSPVKSEVSKSPVSITNDNKPSLNPSELNRPFDFSQEVIVYFSVFVFFVAVIAWLLFVSSRKQQGTIADFTEANKTNPNNAVAYFNRGVDYYNSGDKKRAIADYNQAIKINPNYADAYNSRGIAYSELGDKKSAIADYDQAIKINPNFAYAYNSRGFAYYELGDKKRAIADYDQAIKINPNDAYAYNSRGFVYYELGDKQRAIADYDQAIKINPNDAYAYNSRGIAYAELGDKQRAIADYDQAIKINPNDANTYNNRGNAYAELGDKQRAIADYDQAIKINPNDDEAYYNRGHTYDELGDNQRAIADYNQAIKINPNKDKAYNNRGNVYYKLGDKKRAIADYDQAIKINPNLAKSYNNRGFVYYELGDNQRAIADYNQAIKINPNNANTYNNRGNAYSQLENKKSAIEDFQKAAELYKQQGKQEEYQKIVDALKQLSPN